MSKTKGRPSIEEDEEKQEEYLKMWTQKFYYQKDAFEIAEQFGVTKRTVQNALSWVKENFADLSSKVLLKGAIWSTQQRVKKITKAFEEELAKDDSSTRNLVELNREIRKDSEQLQKLQNIMQEKFEMEIGPNTAEILKAIAGEDED